MKQIYIFHDSTKYIDGTRVKVNNRHCTICGTNFRYDKRRDWVNPDNNACFDCQFWYEKWLKRDNPAVLRIDGVHYRLTTEKGLSAHIVRNDGTEIVTDNLWHQGKIPSVWVGLGLTDNGRFV